MHDRRKERFTLQLFTSVVHDTNPGASIKGRQATPLVSDKLTCIPRSSGICAPTWMRLSKFVFLIRSLERWGVLGEGAETASSNGINRVRPRTPVGCKFRNLHRSFRERWLGVWYKVRSTCDVACLLRLAISAARYFAGVSHPAIGTRINQAHDLLNSCS